MPNNNHKKTGGALKAGVGLATLAAAAAGIYYFYGSKEGAQRRKALKGWAVKARGEVMEKLEKLQNINRETYDAVVDQVINRYKGMKNISVGELLALGRELKGHWNNISKEVGSGNKPAAKSRRKAGTKSKNTKS